jgi:bifunctional DNA-binding transcriptional regulator/antitoxin component of YhaV-PrlF toxin-antitoxin module
MQLKSKVDRHGRLMIPIEWRRKNRVDGEGEVLVCEQQDGSLRLETRAQSIARAQALVRKYSKVKPGQSVVDEFLAERRADAQREQA